MSKKKICLMGRIYREGACDGQTIKTLEIYDELVRRYGKDNVGYLNYYGIRISKPKCLVYPKLLFAISKVFMTSEKIIIASNATSLPNLLKACVMLNKIFKREMHFVLVGAALAEGIDEHPEYKNTLKHFKSIFLETDTAKRELEARGVERLRVMPNFKTIRRYSLEEQPKEFKAPYKLIFMSRIVGLKGVTEMIRELKRINANGVKYTLDMYGMVDEEYAEEFEEIKKDLPDYIQYKGVADAWRTTEIMHGYFLHVFPTKCATEGQPASIIDTFFAGTPVLSGRWNSCSEMIKEGVTGVSFELGNFDDFREKLEYYYDHPEEIMALRAGCVKEAELFIPENAISGLISELED